MVKLVQMGMNMTNMNFCTKCGSYYIVPGTCNCYAVPPKPITTTDPTAGCPCRPENGGNGVCGCYRPNAAPMPVTQVDIFPYTITTTTTPIVPKYMGEWDGFKVYNIKDYGKI